MMKPTESTLIGKMGSAFGATMRRNGKRRRQCLFGGLDIGTSKGNLLIMDDSGKQVRGDSVRLPIPRNSPDGFLAQRPRDWLEATKALFMAASESVALGDIVGLGITATTPTLVFVDQMGRAVDETAVLWCDPHRKGDGRPTNSGLQKLAALLELAPSLFERSRYVLDSGNYICFVMTGEATAGAAALSQKFAWSPETGCDCAGFDAKLLAKFPSRIVLTGEVVGLLRRDISAELGLRANIPVITAGYDSIASVLGGGIGGPSDTLLLTVGTSVGLYMVPTIQVGDGFGSWALRSHLLPDGLRAIAGGFEAGMQSIALLHERMKLTCKAADANGWLEGLVAAAELREPAGCFALPFGGVPLRSPLPGQVLPTAIFSGKDLVPSDPAILVALRRGVAYFVRYGIEDLNSWGATVGRIHIVGGGTRSVSFCQLVADACQLPVLCFGSQAAATGAAILAASAETGRPERERLVEWLSAQAESHHPDEGPRAVYDHGYGQFTTRLAAAIQRQVPNTDPRTLVNSGCGTVAFLTLNTILQESEISRSFLAGCPPTSSPVRGK